MTLHETVGENVKDSSDQGNILREDDILKTAEYYTEVMKERTKGPQLESLEKEWLVEAMEQGEVLLVDIQNEEGEVRHWPLLTSIKHHRGYDPNFLDRHFEDQEVVYLEMPPSEAIDGILEDEDVMSRVVDYLGSTDAKIVYDFRVGDELAESGMGLLQKVAERQGREAVDVTPPNIAFGVDYGIPSGTYYEGVVRMEGEEDRAKRSIQEVIREKVPLPDEGAFLETLPVNGPVLLRPEYLDDPRVCDELWNIYSKQFQNLGEDHPLYTHSPREELLSIFANPENINPIAMQDGHIVGFLQLVNSTDQCVWLNPDYYSQKEAWVAFVPGIVVAEGKARQGLGYAQEMMKLANEVVMDSGRDMIIAFGCTGASKTYIPKIVQSFYEANSQETGSRAAKFKLQVDEHGNAFTPVADYEHHIVAIQ